MESMLAAYGSGAAKVVARRAASASSTSTSAAAPPSSRMVEKGYVDRDRRGAYRRPAAGGRRRRAASCGSIRPGAITRAQAGFDWHERRRASTPKQLDTVAESMADALVAALTQRPMPHAVEHSTSPTRSSISAGSTACMFSGGVGEYVYGRERPRFRRPGPPARPRASAPASMPASCRGRCCRRANASAPPRSARRNTACSSPATPATSPSRASCCRAGTCRCCSRRSNARRRSTPAELAQAIRAISPPST